MKIYFLNSPILTEYGDYEFKKIEIEEVKKLLQKNEIVSAIGHAPTALLLSNILGIEIPANRIQIKMLPGEQAIVFRVLARLPEGVILSEEELLKIPYEFGLLTRIR